MKTATVIGAPYISDHGRALDFDRIESPFVLKEISNEMSRVYGGADPKLHNSVLGGEKLKNASFLTLEQEAVRAGIRVCAGYWVMADACQVEFADVAADSFDPYFVSRRDLEQFAAKEGIAKLRQVSNVCNTLARSVRFKPRSTAFKNITMTVMSKKDLPYGGVMPSMPAVAILGAFLNGSEHYDSERAHNDAFNLRALAIASHPAVNLNGLGDMSHRLARRALECELEPLEMSSGF